MERKAEIDSEEWQKCNLIEIQYKSLFEFNMTYSGLY